MQSSVSLLDFASVGPHKVLDERLHNNLTWLSFPSVASPNLKVLDVGLLKRLIQLKELFISPIGGARLERPCLLLFARFLCSFQVSKVANVTGASASRTERGS